MSLKLPSKNGQPEIHKEQILVCSITSQCDSYAHNLSKFFTKELVPLVGSVSTIHVINSTDFNGKRKSLNLSSSTTESLDADSLFTIVPINNVLGQ